MLFLNVQLSLSVSRLYYTRKNAQVATDLQTSCNKSVHKLFTRCIRTACSEFVGTSLEQVTSLMGLSDLLQDCSNKTDTA